MVVGANFTLFYDGLMKIIILSVIEGFLPILWSNAGAKTLHCIKASTDWTCADENHCGITHSLEQHKQKKAQVQMHSTPIYKKTELHAKDNIFNPVS